MNLFQLKYCFLFPPLCYLMLFYLESVDFRNTGHTTSAKSQTCSGCDIFCRFFVCNTKWCCKVQHSITDNNILDCIILPSWTFFAVAMVQSQQPARRMHCPTIKVLPHIGRTWSTGQTQCYDISLLIRLIEESIDTKNWCSSFCTFVWFVLVPS